MVKEVISILKEKGYTLGTVESLTAGAFASSFGATPGASEVFKGGLITYVNELKTSLANVDKKLLKKYGAVSKEAAEAMARGGKDTLNCNVVVSFTGNAGPTAMENKPVGMVFIGFLINEYLVVDQLSIDGERNEIRYAAIQYAQRRLLTLLKEN